MGSTGRESRGWVAGAGPGSPFMRGRIEGIADVEAIESLPARSVLAGETVYDCLAAAARIDPARTAIVALAPGGSGDVDAALTYGDYLRRSTAAANLFHHLAGDRRSVVALMLPIVPEALVAAWGATAAGVVNPINPHLEPALVISILKAVGATALVTTTAHGPSAADHLADIVAAVPGLDHVFLVGGDDPASDFSGAIESRNGDALDFEPEGKWDSEAMYLPTGGTTAVPKLARLTQGGMALSGWIAGAVMGAEEDEVIGLGMPLFHVGGMLMLALRAAVLGQTVVLLSPAGFRDRGVVGNFWPIVKTHGITSLIATPTTAAALHASPGADHEGHPIRTFSSGGSTIPLELGRAFPERFGIELREVWGATEFHGFLGCMPNAMPPLIGSVGVRTPWHGIKAVEVDEHNRFVREMAPGEQGVIIGSGPCLALGYVDAAADRQFFVEGGPDGRSWGSSGDLGRVGADQFVWIDGRAKDVIIRGGHNIDPALIEEALVRRPDILLAAAVGLPDREKGELPLAFVEAAPGAVVDEAELVQYCRTAIPERAACPVAVVLLPGLPLTPVGKIFKPALRELAIRRAVGAALGPHYDGEIAGIEIVTGKARPDVVVRIAEADDGLCARLSAALQGFAFSARVEPAAAEARPEAVT
jgi:fatty-acyl-CoA synthase